MKRPETAAVKNGLRKRLMELLSSSVSDGRVPPERELAESLGVNRFLLRQCLEDLILEQRLYRIPRKGTFLRQYQAPIVGIVQDFGKPDGFCNFPLIFSGICETLEENNCIIRFLNPHDEKDLASLMERYELSACIVNHTDLPEAAKILEYMPESCRRKTVFISTYPLLLKQELQWNYVISSECSGQRIDSIVNAGGRRIALLAVNPAAKEWCLAHFRKLGLEWKESWDLKDAAAIQEHLPALLRQGEVDSLLADGTDSVFDILFTVLAAQKKFRPVISIAYEKRVKLLRKSYPGIKARFRYYYHAGKNIGVEAGKMAVRICRTGEYQIPVEAEHVFLR